MRFMVALALFAASSAIAQKIPALKRDNGETDPSESNITSIPTPLLESCTL